MEKFVIDGGIPLSGNVVPAGNKNAALPCLAASALTAEEVVVRNVPRIRDVQAMLDLLEHLGATVEWKAEHDVAICAAGITAESFVDPRLSARIRASFLLAGPLLARFGRADMPPPGGDVIGRRRLDPHLDAFRALGARVERHDHTSLVLAGKLRAGEVFMDEPSVMGTENALLAAALTPGETQIFNAASEPHVVDLARMLVKMGADIRGIGSNVLHVTGADVLGGTTHDIGPDHIEIGSFMAMAGMTGGEIRIKDTEPDDLRMIRLVFKRIGLETQLDGADVLVPGGQKLVVERDMGEHTSKVQDGPWPAFPADLTSIAVALATQSEGEVHRPRVDVRVAPVLLRQADLDGRQHLHRRPAPGARARPAAAARRARGVARHPRRDGGPAGRAVCRGADRDRQHPPDRPRLRAHRRAPA